MGKRTGCRRGAPLGNTNRLTHGRYSGAIIAARRERSARMHSAKLIAAWADVVERIHQMERAGLPVPQSLGIGK
jgi:hypothetical protein